MKCGYMVYGSGLWGQGDDHYCEKPAKFKALDWRGKETKYLCGTHAGVWKRRALGGEPSKLEGVD